VATTGLSEGCLNRPGVRRVLVARRDVAPREPCAVVTPVTPAPRPRCDTHKRHNCRQRQYGAEWHPVTPEKGVPYSHRAIVPHGLTAYSPKRYAHDPSIPFYARTQRRLLILFTRVALADDFTWHCQLNGKSLTDAYPARSSDSVQMLTIQRFMTEQNLQAFFLYCTNVQIFTLS
jgi:hypothetical protein